MVEGGLPYPMIADITGKISSAYGVYDEDKGVTLRGTFIIDDGGYIQGMEMLNTPIGRSTSELLRLLKAFQYNAATGKLMPADWEEGSSVLTDSVENAGNIWTQWKPKNQ